MVLQSGTKQDLSYKLEIASRIKDKLGLTLVMHDLVDAAIVEKALNDKDSKNGNSANVRSKRSLAEILVEDYDIDHDIIYKTTASVYGFREISLDESDFQDNRIDFIKKMFEPLPEATRDYMISRKIIPFRYDPSNPYKLIFIAADPTDRMISAIARAMKVKSFDVCYAPLDPVSKLLDRVFPPENEFLKDLEHEMEFGEDDFEEEEFDEAQIEAEINKSLLVNLVEGMLIEAVRKGASDIHIVPAGSSTTEIHFRIDGTLRPWHMQEGIRPEAITAVMKDRAKNIDRFEREKAQDGFIQRKVDGHMIRFRVSTIPIVGSEYLYKFESIVIRILDDRQVITDLDKLGFHGRARQMFVKAIKQPQGMVIVTGPTGSGKSTL